MTSSSLHRTDGFMNTPWQAPVQSPVPATGSAAPSKPKAPAPSSTKEEPVLDPETLAVLKSSYPDLATAPVKIRELIEKADKAALQIWEDDISTATEKLKKSRKTLNNILEAKEKHRQSWLSHLEKSATEWRGMLTAYTKQQDHFNGLIGKTKEDMKAANQIIAAMNQKADMALNQDVKEEEAKESLDHAKDKHEVEMRERVQSLLQQCIDLTTEEDAIEVEEETEEPKKKRGRSAEPTGGHGGEDGTS